MAHTLPENSHVKILLSYKATLKMENAGCHKAGVEEYKKLFSVSTGFFSRVITS